MTQAKAYSADLSIEDDGLIMLMWKLKLDTYEIATRLNRPEWQVANRLRALREAERMENAETSYTDGRCEDGALQANVP